MLWPAAIVILIYRPLSMKKTRPKVRLYVESELRQNSKIKIAKRQLHYLKNVMRFRSDDAVRIFNGKDGEWSAIIRWSSTDSLLVLDHQLRKQISEPDLWLLFSPIKRINLEIMIQKAVELGVRKLIPVRMNRTVVDRINLERLQTIAIEAAEQCERLTIPSILPLEKLNYILSEWQKDRVLFFCDLGAVTPMIDVLNGFKKVIPSAILIGPEGGVDRSERTFISDHLFVKNVALGSRVLRAETAALSGLVLWQSILGERFNGG